MNTKIGSTRNRAYLPQGIISTPANHFYCMLFISPHLIKSTWSESRSVPTDQIYLKRIQISPSWSNLPPANQIHPIRWKRSKRIISTLIVSTSIFYHIYLDCIYPYQIIYTPAVQGWQLIKLNPPQISAVINSIMNSFFRPFVFFHHHLLHYYRHLLLVLLLLHLKPRPPVSGMTYLNTHVSSELTYTTANFANAHADKKTNRGMIMIGVSTSSGSTPLLPSPSPPPTSDCPCPDPSPLNTREVI